MVSIQSVAVDHIPQETDPRMLRLVDGVYIEMWSSEKSHAAVRKVGLGQEGVDRDAVAEKLLVICLEIGNWKPLGLFPVGERRQDPCPLHVLVIRHMLYP